MAWCFCDICDYKDECEYYRKVVVCPYSKVEEVMALPKNYSIWLAVDYNGIEKAFWLKPKKCEKHREWWGDKMVLPHGSIKKLIGRELSWEDEPVELKDN
jgi:hypothetical protein